MSLILKDLLNENHARKIQLLVRFLNKKNNNCYIIENIKMNLFQICYL